MDPQDATPFDCEDPPIVVGETIRNVLTGKTYRVREVRVGCVIAQRGSTAVKLRTENIERVETNK